MRAEDVVGLVVGLAVVIIALSLYIGLIVLGVKMAKRKNRSPHWFWFAVHPMGLIITLIVMACLSPLKRCPRCAQISQQGARLCGFCGYDFAAAAYIAPPQAVYVSPGGY